MISAGRLESKSLEMEIEFPISVRNPLGWRLVILVGAVRMGRQISCAVSRAVEVLMGSSAAIADMNS